MSLLRPPESLFRVESRQFLKTARHCEPAKQSESKSVHLDCFVPRNDVVLRHCELAKQSRNKSVHLDCFVPTNDEFSKLVNIRLFEK